MYTHAIWDFNGTISDDVSIGVGAINVMLKKRNLPILESFDEYRQKFKFPIIEYYKSLGFNLEKESYEVLADEWIELYRSEIPNIKLFDGVISALSEISKINPKIKQIIISSSETLLMKHQLHYLKIESYFNEIYGLDNVLAGGKAHLVKSWNEKASHGKVIFIGDTEHDYEVSRLIENSDCVLFTKGHGNIETLRLCGVPLIDNIGDFVKYVLPEGL